jgi:hypothetical protein
VATARPLSVLLLADDRPGHAGNLLEHVAAFRRHSRHRIQLYNPRGVRRVRALNLDAFDVVVIHYSLVTILDSYLAPPIRDRLEAFQGLKVQFIQDEYRWVDEVTAMMRRLGISLLYSLVPEETVPLVYGGRLPGVEVKTTFAGYAPEELEHSHPRTSDRPLDVVYRGRAIPYWLGRLGQEKIEIGRGFLERADPTLRCDIAWAEIDRIYGEAWYRFLASARTTLGTESGASIVDFDGSIERRTNEYLAERPEATFEEVHAAILEPYEGRVTIQVVSPRVFEAAALRTALVCFPGAHSGVIEPWEHYVPLEKDFSNLAEVEAVIRDAPTLERLAARAHDDLIASGAYSLRRFIRQFDDDIAERAQPRGRRRRTEIAVGAEQGLNELRIRASLGVNELRKRRLRRIGRALVEQDPPVAAVRRAAEAALPRGRFERIFDDVVRLAILRGAQSGAVDYFGEPFVVAPRVTREGRELTFVSVAPRDLDAAASPAVRKEIETSLTGRRLETMVWNHTRIGLSVVLPAFGGTAALEVGHYIVSGAYQFAALSELARRRPELLVEVLAPLFEPPAGAVLERQALEKRQPALQRLATAPRAAATRGLLALRVALATRELRRLLLGYARNARARREVAPAALLEELLKLRLLRDAARGALAGVRIDVSVHDGTLTFTTVPHEAVGAANGAAVGALLDARTKRIVWDHSAVGTRVVHPDAAVEVSLGTDGVYEFHALAALTQHLPAETAEALSL